MSWSSSSMIDELCGTYDKPDDALSLKIKKILSENRTLHNRNMDIGERAVCYLGNGFKENDGTRLLTKNRFVAGTVIPGWRHGDGCLSVRADEKIHTGEFEDGHGLGYGSSRPDIMREYDYYYLLTNLKYARQWLDEVKSKRIISDFDPDVMYNDLKKESERLREMGVLPNAT